MRIRLLCVGKGRTKHLDGALDDYLKRLTPLVRIDDEIVPSSGTTTETAMLLKRISDDEYVVLLDERGTLMTTPDVAARIERWQNDAVKTVVIIIGGAHGVGPEVHDRADLVWSLSPLVFPHELARLIVVEQLYRAYDLLRGGKYHHY